MQFREYLEELIKLAKDKPEILDFYVASKIKVSDSRRGYITEHDMLELIVEYDSMNLEGHFLCECSESEINTISLVYHA